MRNIKILIIYALLVVICGFNQNSHKKTKIFDERFVGLWSGAEKDEQIKGVQKNWKITRLKDGIYTIDFITKYFDDENNFIYEDKSSETGNWWIIDSLYYEKSKLSKKPDIYTFEVVDENHILFKAKKLNTKSENTNYSFIDTRVQ
ncbi:conserved hypothetical protein [uncultured Paludibacter sp.]|nr:conserved hypothetical protein [uncultured Paludibacter sp.]